MEQEKELSAEEIRAVCQEVLKEQAVTNISGWTEPNCGTPCDEEAYRRRLRDQAHAFHKKIAEALTFE